VFCVTDLVACGFMDEARHRFALRVPEDLCMIGYDNIAQAGWSSYNLTTFSQPVEQFAQDAVKWLIQTEQEETGFTPQVEQQHDSLLYQADVVWRGSVRGG
jgi:DNA-binding LacI/PurR family transcriptional regulator